MRVAQIASETVGRTPLAQAMSTRAVALSLKVKVVELEPGSRKFNVNGVCRVFCSGKLAVAPVQIQPVRLSAPTQIRSSVRDFVSMKPF
jgi:hypothetical protein